MNQPGLMAFLADQWLLSLTIVALLAWLGGHLLHRSGQRSGGALKGLGYFLVTAALLLTIADATRRAVHSDAAQMLAAKPEVTVSGKGETVIPASKDSHYWVEATAGGQTFDFLIDTGATYTTVSKPLAQALNLTPDPDTMPIELNTANGPITARMGHLPDLRFGSVAAQNVEVVLSPLDGDSTNLIGMNLLSRLASWRVEQDKLILVPKSGINAVEVPLHEP